jgi:HlyD family secretion protein
MSTWEPLDIRSSRMALRGVRTEDSFGPQGAELIGELRRIESLFKRRPAPATSLAARKPDGNPYAKHSFSRIPSMNPVRRDVAKGAIPVGLEGVSAEGHMPSDHGRRMRTQVARSGAGPERSDGGGAQRQSSERASRAAADSITNILELPIGELGRSRARANGAIDPTALDVPADRDHRQQSSRARRRARWNSLNRGFWLCNEHLAASYAFVIGGGRNRGASEVQGLDSDANLIHRLRRGFEDELRAGIRVLVVGVGLAGGWAMVVPLAAAVTVSGTLVVESDVKKIQHPVGGVVAKITAHDGLRVEAGDLLVHLDETQVRANLQVITNQLDETRVRMARLVAERDGLDEPRRSGELLLQKADPDTERLMASETSLFKARLGARQNQKQLLQSNIAQLGEQIVGLDAQIKSKAAQLALIAGELQGLQALFDKQLVPLTRLTTLQRQAAQLDGERSQLTSAIAETRSKISQAQLQIIKIDQDLRSEVMKDLRESQDKESELTQRIVAARDQLNRVEIRAPSAGTVHQLSVHTIGGVIGPGEVIMEIVPDKDGLQIEARLRPIDIDQVRVGQQALVRFSAFNQRTTPQVNAVVSYVSADLTQEPQSRTAYYTIRMTLPAAELRRLGNLQLVSGMPAEVFLQTGSRTMMSYLLKPITDQLQRTFSER